MSTRRASLSAVITIVALVLAPVLAACSSDDDDGGAAAPGADEGAVTTDPPEPIGTLTFGGETYELTRSDCDVGGEGLSRWFAFDADGDVELAVYAGEADSVALLVRDDHADGPAWEQDEDPSLVEIDGDEAGVTGAATVAPAGTDEASADASEAVEFEFTC